MLSLACHNARHLNSVRILLSPNELIMKYVLRSSRALIIVLAGLMTTWPSVADDVDKLDIDRTNPRRMILHVCEADGTPIRPLVSDVQLRNKFDRQGTPDVTTDGTLVVYDAWKVGGDWQDARIVTVNIDGSNARDVTDGVMPSFAPDGKRMVVSRSPKMGKPEGAEGQSIWVMDIDGSDKKMIADHGAQGARWSPDGKSLVFFGGVDAEGKAAGNNCLRLYDFESETISYVFRPEQSPFKTLIQHFDWPKENKRLVAFGGALKKGGSATAVVDVDEGHKFKIISDESDMRTFHGLSVDWHPAGKHLLVTGFEGRRPVPQWLAIDKDAERIEFTGLPDDVGVRDPVLTPEGKYLIASFHAL